MPAITKIKLRAGTQAAWAATAKTQSLSAAAVTGSGDSTVVRYTASGHTFVVGNVVTITGFGVSSGGNPYNISGGTITAVASGSFDISVASGTTGGTSTGTGTATLIVLAVGETAVETNNSRIKIGDGVTSWARLDYTNKPLFYVLNTSQNIAGTTNEQNLFDNRIALNASSTYSFEIQVIILCANTTAKHIDFGFEQTGMTAWSDARYQWVYGTRENASIHYATGAKTVTGNSPALDGLIQLGPDSASPEDVFFFTVKGIIRTGSGSSFFQPRIAFSASPGTGTTVLSGSFMSVDLIGDSPFVISPKWVSN